MTHVLEPEELRAALAAADRLRADGLDQQHVARAIQQLYSRCQALEALLQTTDRYLRFGMPEHELSRMRLLVGRLRETELAAEGSGEVDSTLPI